ncbi:hypothetical protein L1F30_02505 [Simiduia sp. 21SJ11W-1]|uniref:hypothetical protein n=1 Tax=Simiduia sp. 21SJ11W-1 TaxID=2909669 RepID=UPI0020A1EFF3|nr:hypothetical protein [Simiduia sp. 21SJ11W-1]UTA48428.1 hypothetical protein L1F30_02505 [Simiduia sp. 21SJ11W-1]
MKIIARTAALVLLLNTTACGYFLYPERVGQTDGRVDPTVVILDAAGLLFGILPGVVAFAVDLSTGAIYLPAGGTSAVEKHTKRLSQLDLEAVDEKSQDIDREKVAEELSLLIGQRVNAADLAFYRSADQHASLAMAGH